jgi:hypothetical protein
VGRLDARGELAQCVAAVRRDLERFGRGSADTDARRTERLASTITHQLLAAAVRFVEDIDVLHLYDELRRRFPDSALRERRGEIDAFGFDADHVEDLRPLLDFLYEHGWRVRVSGVESIPDVDRVWLAVEDTTSPPWAALAIAHAIEREHPSHRRPRFLVADACASLPFAAPELARLGGVNACAENAERLLVSGHWIVAPARWRSRGDSMPARDADLAAVVARVGATIVPVTIETEKDGSIPGGRPAPRRIRFGRPVETDVRTA